MKFYKSVKFKAIAGVLLLIIYSAPHLSASCPIIPLHEVSLSFLLPTITNTNKAIV